MKLDTYDVHLCDRRITFFEKLISSASNSVLKLIYCRFFVETKKALGRFVVLSYRNDTLDDTMTLIIAIERLNIFFEVTELSKFVSE